MLSFLIRLSLLPVALVTGLTLIISAILTSSLAIFVLSIIWFLAHLRPATIITYSCTVAWGNLLISYLAQKIASIFQRRRPRKASPNLPPTSEHTATQQPRALPSSLRSSRRSSFSSTMSVHFADDPLLSSPTSANTSRPHQKSLSYSLIPSILPSSSSNHHPHPSHPSEPNLNFAQTPRDFETIGGWRDQGPREEEELWMELNSRLELPRRASHSSSQQVPLPTPGATTTTWIGANGGGNRSGRTSPETGRSPAVRMREFRRGESAGERRSRSGSESPVEYFNGVHGGGGSSGGLGILKRSGEGSSRGGSEVSLRGLQGLTASTGGAIARGEGT